MKIKIYPIRSIMSHDNSISSDSKVLLDSLSEFEFEYISDFKTITNSDLVLILVQSGGSEGIFKSEIYPNFKGPYYLLTYGSNNSLAASLEILTFLKQETKKCEVLHGSSKYISSRIHELAKMQSSKEKVRLGILGEPSDWLISSNVDKDKCRNVFDIDLVSIDQDEVIKAIENHTNFESSEASKYDFNKKEINKALQIYEGLKEIVAKYELDGFTIRCFDIIQKVKSSACLSLALFNKDNIIASCEGDVPAMLSAYTIQKVTGKHSFQANPQHIDPENNIIELAHCTLPLDMCNKITYDTHFESGIGVGIHGEFDLTKVTILKINAELNEFYCETGEIIKNEYRKDRCRTQIHIKLDADVSYFLRASLGNHHLVVLGDEKEKITKYLQELGLRKVTF